MRATVDWGGICQVTVLSYYSAKEAIAITDATQMFDVENLSSYRYVFAMMEGCVEEIVFNDDCPEDGEALLLHQYWTGRNGDISNNWKLFQTLSENLVSSFWRIHQATRQELPKGAAILETTPDFSEEPDTEKEKKSGKSGKKRT